MNYLISPSTWKINQTRSHLWKMSSVILNHFLASLLVGSRHPWKHTYGSAHSKPSHRGNDPSTQSQGRFWEITKRWDEGRVRSLLGLRSRYLETPVSWVDRVEQSPRCGEEQWQWGRHRGVELCGGPQDDLIVTPTLWGAITKPLLYIREPQGFTSKAQCAPRYSGFRMCVCSLA